MATNKTLIDAFLRKPHFVLKCISCRIMRYVTPKNCLAELKNICLIYRPYDDLFIIHTFDSPNCVDFGQQTVVIIQFLLPADISFFNGIFALANKCSDICSDGRR